MPTCNTIYFSLVSHGLTMADGHMCEICLLGKYFSLCATSTWKWSVLCIALQIKEKLGSYISISLL